MSSTEPKTDGWFAPLRRMADTVLSLAQNRLHLFAVELEEEKLRLLDVAVQLAIAVAVATVGMLLATLTLGLYAWEKARYTGLIVMAGVFLLSGGFLLWRLRQSLRAAPRPFAKTIAEFEKDSACLLGKD